MDEYKQKLVVDSKNLEDPFDIKKKNGWVGKENGIKLCPKLYLTDITRFYGDTFDKKVEFNELSVITSKGKLTDILLTILSVKFIKIISVIKQSIVI